MKKEHEHFMSRALELAAKGYGSTSPNPMVGCVIVRGSRIVGEGYHKAAGLPHAEVNALRHAGARARGSDLYVTLEPCCHFGRTPPCANAIIKAGVKRVIFGMKDPNPKVSGGGLRVLKAAGVKVIGPVLEEKCRKLNAPFIKWVKTGIPYVTAKIAITLDGKIADFRGDSQWISNEKSRKFGHMLRAGVDIVMVGATTAGKDKPRLNVRLKGYKGKQPLPVVVGSKRGRKVDLKKLLKELGSAGFQSILVEGGGKLHTEMIKLGLIDHMVIFIAPKLLGSSAAPWIGDLGRLKINAPIRMSINHSFMLDDNIVVTAVLNP